MNGGSSRGAAAAAAPGSWAARFTREENCSCDMSGKYGGMGGSSGSSSGNNGSNGGNNSTGIGMVKSWFFQPSGGNAGGSSSSSSSSIPGGNSSNKPGTWGQDYRSMNAWMPQGT